MYIKLKSSTTANSPTTSAIAEGELAIQKQNKIYTKNNTNNITLIRDSIVVDSAVNLPFTTLSNQLLIPDWTTCDSSLLSLVSYPNAAGKFPQYEITSTYTTPVNIGSLLFRQLANNQLAILYVGKLGISSDNGATWTYYTVPSSSTSSGFYYSDPYYLIFNYAMYGAGLHYYSSDLVTWTNMNMLNQFGMTADIVKTSTGKLVAWPSGYSYGYNSTNNGVNWNWITGRTAVYCMAVSTGVSPETIIGLYNGGVSYSINDDVSITNQAIDANFTNFCACIWTGTQFVALAQNTNRIYYSTNGISWTLEYLPSTDYWGGLSYSTVDQTLLIYPQIKPYLLIKNNGVWTSFKHPNISSYVTTTMSTTTNRGMVSDYHRIFMSSTRKLYTLQSSTDYAILPDLRSYNFRQIKL